MRAGFVQLFRCYTRNLLEKKFTGITKRGRPNRRLRNARQSSQQETLTIRQQLLNP
jgi:hypothetical protein